MPTIPLRPDTPLNAKHEAFCRAPSRERMTDRALSKFASALYNEPAAGRAVLVQCVEPQDEGLATYLAVRV